MNKVASFFPAALLSDQVVVFKEAVVAALLSGLHLCIKNKI